jgi:hypothetical protein
MEKNADGQWRRRMTDDDDDPVARWEFVPTEF